MNRKREDYAVKRVDVILGAVADEFEVLAAELLGRRRTAKIATARMLVYWLAWFDGISYSAIGRRLGRDHSTVIAGVHRINARLRVEDDLADHVARIAKAVDL